MSGDANLHDSALHRGPYATFLLGMEANTGTEATMNLYHVTFTNGYRQGRDRIVATSPEAAVAQARTNHRQRGGRYSGYTATFVRQAGPEEWE